eukprot:scaffold219923_cov50-Prasinocladus_malaysianus.AAC.2
MCVQHSSIHDRYHSEVSTRVIQDDFATDEEASSVTTHHRIFGVLFEPLIGTTDQEQWEYLGHGGALAVMKRMHGCICRRGDPTDPRHPLCQNAIVWLWEPKRLAFLRVDCLARLCFLSGTHSQAFHPQLLSNSD